MKNAQKLLAVLAACALLAPALAGCAPGPQRLLAGKWQASALGLEFGAYEFVPGENDPLRGTVNLGRLSGFVSGSYTVTPGKGDAPDRLRITYGLRPGGMISYTRDYTFTVDETTLTLQEENSSVSLTYTRNQG